jgi:hypothetical protein
MMEFVSWDDFPFPIYGKIIQIFQTTNQDYSKTLDESGL